MGDNKQIVIFGAGKIGRSFIGQLFGCSGYDVVFIDVDPELISNLNKKGSYRVIIKGENEEEIIVPNVSAISAFEKEKVIEAVSKTSILAVSVGKNVLERIVPIIAAGIEKRYSLNQDNALDIILAENMRSAADFMRISLMQHLSANIRIDSFVGLIETSIGKMVPIISQTALEEDPLVVFAEAYNTLILDEKGFKNPIPPVKGLAPKSNIKAWVDRKAFIHNLGHATASYYGYSKHPEALYIFEVLENPEVLSFTRNVMLQAADVLLTAYPDEFTLKAMEEHIDDLLCRFRNKSLKDTVYRVGLDLPRKLGSDDRFMGAVHLAMKLNKPYNLIVEAMTYGLQFKATDEFGHMFTADKEFSDSLAEDIHQVFVKLLHFNNETDKQVTNQILSRITYGQ